MKRLIIMRGVPGSGKSTEARRIRDEAVAAGLTSEVFSADDFFLHPDPRTGLTIYQYNPRLLDAAHSDANAKIAMAVTQGVDVVIVDNTNLTAYECGGYAVMGVDNDYEVEFREPTTQLWTEFREYRKECKGKIDPNHPLVDRFTRATVHNIPRHSIVRKMSKWQPDITVDDAIAAVLGV